ncbi:flagellar basal body-associated FliL family protein [Pseudoxanthomonas sp.]|uniref:flagellar basal body-associated FliL family protein n=1 Tax=Pseudoxanthomonas sp. TaxID=1871049 RepID=UPI0026241845|nr:flagellar basal body-associated FliL family protein [Pseudoxanthomonas sp.]WDS36831.1 MAG: flagellar basal body-associated FliL family protein [Pseudoxanthomonas sp.]
MATAADKSKKSADAKPAAMGSKPSKPMLIGAAVLLVLGTAGGTWFLVQKPSSGHDKAQSSQKALPKPAQYFAMDPAFVVNLDGTDDGPRYLQLEVQLVTRDPEDLKQIQDNAPAIRAHLLMLFSQVKAADIADIAGRKKLQAAALAEAQKLMTTETGSKRIDDLLFTSFVTQ